MPSRNVSTLACGLMVLVFALVALGQTASGGVKICRGVPIPEGYVIVAFVTSPVCPNGAYVIKQEPAGAVKREAAGTPNLTGGARETQPQVTRPRVIGNAGFESEPLPNEQKQAPALIRAAPLELEVEERPIADSRSGPEEVGEGDVVRVNTTLVTIPVSVSDRDGRFVPDLRREDFRLFEDGEEQTITYFDETEKPFTVALMLDTSASTCFKLDEIKEAAIRFAGQLRPHDRVLVVTFNDEVLLLTEVTNDRAIINDVIRFNAQTGNTTRLYDAIELLVRKRLNKIAGRKAIVLFTDGVDTSSRFATHASSMYMAEELDALIYPIQYDTFDDMNTSVGGGSDLYSARRRNGWPSPGAGRTSTSGDILNSPGSIALRVMREAYEQANHYLRGLAEKTGGRLYRADDPAQLARAFSMIAEELRQQYSLGYYPKLPELAAGERRQIRVRLQRSGLAVRARDSYIATAVKRDGGALR